MGGTSVPTGLAGTACGDRNPSHGWQGSLYCAGFSALASISSTEAVVIGW